MPGRGLPELATPKEVARHLQVHVQTVRRWIHDGRLATYRTSESGSGRVLIRRTEIERFLETLRQ